MAGLSLQVVSPTARSSDTARTSLVNGLFGDTRPAGGRHCDVSAAATVPPADDRPVKLPRAPEGGSGDSAPSWRVQFAGLTLVPSRPAPTTTLHLRAFQPIKRSTSIMDHEAWRYLGLKGRPLVPTPSGGNEGRGTSTARQATPGAPNCNKFRGPQWGPDRRLHWRATPIGCTWRPPPRWLGPSRLARLNRHHDDSPSRRSWASEAPPAAAEGPQWRYARVLWGGAGHQVVDVGLDQCCPANSPTPPLVTDLRVSEKMRGARPAAAKNLASRSGDGCGGAW